MFLWWPNKNCYSLAENSDSSTVITRHCTSRIAIYFSLYKNSLNGKKIKFHRKTIKGTWNYSLLKDKKFWEDRIMALSEKWQKIVEQSSEPLFQSCRWKPKMCLLFYLKTKGTFWPTHARWLKIHTSYLTVLWVRRIDKGPTGPKSQVSAGLCFLLGAPGRTLVPHPPQL